MSVLSGLPYDSVGLGLITTLMIVGIFRGWVVPRSVMESRMADKDKQIAILVEERDAWHEAHTVSEEGKMKAISQVGDLVRATETSTRLADSMRNYLERSTQRQIEGG
jgi:transposase